MSPDRPPIGSGGLVSAGKIPSLDGVRAISFLIVFTAHSGLDWIVPGRFGVSIFFLLSGYLITTLMIRERAKTGRISLKLFYARRSLRIFPPMYVILAGTLLYLWLTHQTHGITAGGLCSQLFYYQNYWYHGGIIPGLGPLWSLAVEEHFYLLFPPLMVIFLDCWRLSYADIARKLLWICLAILIWRCIVVAYMPEGIRWARDQTDTRADSILFGCVLACLEQTPFTRRIFTRTSLERRILPACLLTLLVTFVVRNPVFRETARYTLQGLAIAPLLYYVVHAPETRPGRFLNTRLLGRLGTLSYSLYLLHVTVLLEINRMLHSKLAAAPLAFILSVALAQLIHIVVEKPAERLRNNFRYTRMPSPQMPPDRIQALSPQPEAG